MIRAALLLALLPQAAAALVLDRPAGAEVTHQLSQPGAARIATGAWRDGAVPMADFPGQVSQQVWRLDGTASTYDLLAPIEAQLRAGGFEILATCATRDCGGFDFRFAVEVVPEPAMHVDLGDFRYLVARRQRPEGVQAVAVLASRSDSAGFLQVTEVDPAAAAPDPGPAPADPSDTPPDAPPAAEPGALAARLEQQGHAALDDLVFPTGSSDLGEGSYASLAELAEYLLANPARTVALVGHTDAVGGLEPNIALSKRRAASVVDRLVQRHGVPRAQLDAQGVGFLAPRDSNLSDAGRTRNRRVEVVLTSTE